MPLPQRLGSWVLVEGQSSQFWYGAPKLNTPCGVAGLEPSQHTWQLVFTAQNSRSTLQEPAGAAWRMRLH